MPLKIVGIVRPAKGSVTGNTYGAIGYTSALTDYAIDHADNTEIIQKQLADPDVDVFTAPRSRTPRPPRPIRKSLRHRPI